MQATEEESVFKVDSLELAVFRVLRRRQDRANWLPSLRTENCAYSGARGCSDGGVGQGKWPSLRSCGSSMPRIYASSKGMQLTMWLIL